MHTSDKSKSFDYSYLVSVGGVGILLSCAVLMFGIGSGNVRVGYLGGAFVLLSTAVFLLLVLVRASAAISKQAMEISLVKNDKAGIAMLMTSMSGELVYANKPAKALFEKYELGKPKSPLKIAISDKNVIQETIDTISTGEVKNVVAQVRDSEAHLQFEVEKFYKNGDFYSWRIFENVEKGDPTNFNELGPDYFQNIGSFFEKTEIGFFTVNENDSVTYANDFLMKLIFKAGKKPDFPFNLSLISQHSRSNLVNKVQFVSSGGGHFDAAVKEWPNSSIEGVNCYLAILSEAVEGKSEKNAIDPKSRDNFFSSSPIGIAVINKKGEILDKNIVFSNFIAELDLENYGHLSDILSEENAAEVFKEVKVTLKSGKASAIIELDFKGVSDKQGQFYITSAGGNEPSKDEAIIYLTDITKQKSLELQFSQSQKMQAVGQLAGGVAHDFNNLLTAISGHCDLLLLRHDQGDGDYADLVQIHQNANRAAALVGQLLAYSRKQNLQPEVLDLRNTLSDSTHLLNRLVGERVQLTLDHDPGLSPIRADKRQLEQVLMNLVVNARDAMPEGGEIRIETRNATLTEGLHRDRAVVPEGDYVVVRVSDKGTGIAPDKIGKIFEPFYSSKRTGEGTGLGLSMAYGIVKHTGGYIFVDSELGQGTDFTLYFPTFDVQAIPEVAAPKEDGKSGDLGQEQPENGEGVVLLVEDEAPVRAFASRALRMRGYTVIEADCAEKALETLEDGTLSIDLFVTDVIMPGMDGPSWVRQALKSRPDVKVVFVSGYAEGAFGETDEKIPNSVFLPKPFSLSELTQTVHSQLH